jgi:hypothetical protein
MNLRIHGPCGHAFWSGLLVLLLFGLPSNAFSAPPPESGAAPAVCPSVAAGAPVLLAQQSWWTPGAMYKGLAHFLSNRGHLIQFCTVGMIVALFVIMRNKW